MRRLNGFVITLFTLSVVGGFVALGGPDSWLIALLPLLLLIGGFLDGFLDLLEEDAYRVRGAVVAGLMAGLGSFVLTVAIVSWNRLAMVTGSGIVLAAIITLELAMERMADVERMRSEVVSNHVLNAVFYIVGAVVVLPLTVIVVGVQYRLIGLTLLTLFIATVVAFVQNERSRRKTLEAFRETYEGYL